MNTIVNIKTHHVFVLKVFDGALMDLVVCDHSDGLAAYRPSLWLSGDQGAAAGEQGLGFEQLFWKREHKGAQGWNQCSSYCPPFTSVTSFAACEI